ncbi:MAG: hypothetical protein HKO81_09665 [Flavobacteriaceae bacterium]|nr:hypothetical protein [Bacteroidia bacterium]NNL16891.1 hypothetical protein [Flavobacteriaceae bacterium]
MDSNSFMHFVEYELQAIALTWMVIMYTIKAVQLSKLPMPWEKEKPRGSGTKGILRSYGSIFMPWSVESSRDNIGRWIGFSLYHVGCLVAIVNTFTYTFTPGIMTPTVKIVFSALIAPAIFIGFVKFYRRLSRPELRHISTPDDYFSLLSLQLFFFTGIMALLLDTIFWRSSYYIITAAFLFYVPFSKISHYIYFFFARFLTGKRYGWRGIIPQK